MEISIQYSSREVNPQFASFVDGSELVIICAFLIQMPNGTSVNLDVVYPLQTLKPIATQLRSRMQSDTNDDVSWRERMEHAILNIPLNVTAFLGHPVMSMGQLIRLKTGDVVPIQVNDGIELRVEDNPISIKVWDASENLEYEATSIEFDSDGLWGEFFTVVSELDANRYGCTDFDAINYDSIANTDDGSCYYSIQQEISLQGGMLNNIALCLDLGNPSVTNVFTNNDVVFVTDDEGNYYIPGNNVNTIENIQNRNGYQVLLAGQNNQTLIAEGYPLDFTETPITLEPFTLNNIPYLPSEVTTAILKNAKAIKPVNNTPEAM